MIARHGERRHAERLDAIDESAGLPELLRLGPLGQIARDHHEVGPLPLHELDHPRGDLREVRRPEVDVGDVEDGAQATGLPNRPDNRRDG